MWKVKKRAYPIAPLIGDYLNPRGIVKVKDSPQYVVYRCIGLLEIGV